MTRKNSSGNGLDLYAQAKGDRVEPTGKNEMTHLTDPVVTDENGVEVNTFQYSITTANDSYFNLWLEKAEANFEPEKVTIKLFDNAGNQVKVNGRDELVYEKDQTGNTATLGGNNQLDIYSLTHSDAFNAKPTFQVVVESTAESGNVVRYVINVYRKSSEAKLDMTNDSDDDIGFVDTEWSTVEGKAGISDPSVRPQSEFAWYWQTVSQSALRTDDEGRTQVPVELFTVENVLGQRAGTIQVLDGENGNVYATYTGWSDKVYAPIGKDRKSVV